ncbi:hypothetical protein [Algoriphagus namhaensis]
MLVKKILPLLVLLALASFSCGRENIDPILVCAAADPVLELDWLNTLTSELDDSVISTYYYITAAVYQNQEVFILKNCCPNCNAVELVYTCSGETIGFLARDGVSIDPSEISEETVIWRGFNFSCGV